MSWSKPLWKATFSILLTWAILFGVYLLLVGNALSSELIVGAGLAAGVTALFLWSKALIVFPLRLRWAFIAPAVRLPGAVLRVAGLLFVALAQDLFHLVPVLRRVHSEYVGDYVVWFMVGAGAPLAALASPNQRP